MPTIDQLPPAVSVSDTDELIVSQSDIARSATRAQLLSGVQAALALPSSTLLGRISTGIGSPETIGIGANLTIGNGALNAPAPFIIAALGLGRSPSAIDLVPVAQGGQNAAIPYGTFMGGLGALTGINAANLTLEPTGGIATRRLADLFADAMSVESFGAVGDGVTDDTAAFTAAAASGIPLRLDARVYVINGPLVIAATTAMVGVAGVSVVTRTSVTSPSSWISATGPEIAVHGVEFDAAGLAGGDMPAFSVAPSCLSASFVQCSFKNAVGTTSGSGLWFSTQMDAYHSLTQCRFSGNSLHGVYASGSGAIQIVGSLAQSNGNCGVRVDAGLTCSISANRCLANGLGISVGNWSVGAGSALASSCSVSGNTCSGNSLWGIAVSGYASVIDGNFLQGNGSLSAGGGMIARIVSSRLTSNLITGGLQGVDARGCTGCLIADNQVSTATTGLALGGSQNLAVRTNALLSNGWGISVSAIEPSLSFNLTGPITISGNWIGFAAAAGGGITVTDGTQGLAITDNDINGTGSATIDQAMWLHTDAAIVQENRWNNTARFKIAAGQVAGLEAIVVPDIADEVLVTSAPMPIESVLTAHQADTIGQIAFIKVIAGGAGYTQAQVSIAGSGLGAAATAIVSGGQVLWVILTNPGSGYGVVGSMAGVTIVGDGTGATATAYVGLPVIEGRQLRLSCNTQVQLALGGSAPTQQSWTDYTSTIPAYATVDLEGAFGAWRAVAFPPVDYLAPTGDGGVIVQTVGSGNLTLRPSVGGALHLASSAETVGCTSSVGRGSPLGSVSAPPGSDFRNLNGGPGNTFWVKQQNSDATGWVAIG